jgi:hypothetical protein
VGGRPRAHDDVTDFAEQLTAPPYVLDARTAPRRVPPRSRGGPAVPGVMLLSRAHDSELDAVGTQLTRANIPHLRIDADHLHNEELFIDPVTGHVSLGGREIAPTVTWIRHFAATAIPRNGHPVADQFIRESWLAAATLLSSVSTVTIAADGPSVPVQMRLAARLGVAVPRTVVTNDLARAGRMIGSRLVVVKAAHQHFVEAEPGLLSGVFPVMVSSDRLTSLSVPVIVQEYVEHDAELRVYYLDGHLECFEVGKAAPADPWMATERVTARFAPPPPGVARDVRLLARAMSLRYAAFDFLLRGRSGIFLEANPDGDWRWLEAKAGQHRVTAAAGRMLSGLHHASCSRSSPFNLLAFLAADGAPRTPEYHDKSDFT